MNKVTEIHISIIIMIYSIFNIIFALFSVLTFTLLQVFDCQADIPINRQSFFDLELLRYSAENKKGNVMISPASIKSTLAMLLEGANGQTAAEIKTALRMSAQSDEFRDEVKVFLRAFEVNKLQLRIY